MKSNGLSDPLKPLFNNGSVLVEVQFNDPRLFIREGADVDAYDAEIAGLKAKIEEQKKEIKSLNILLEKEKEKFEETPGTKFEGKPPEITDELIEDAKFEIPEPKKDEKPKPKRKKKK